MKNSLLLHYALLLALLTITACHRDLIKFSFMSIRQVFLLALLPWSLPAQEYHPFIQSGFYRDEFGAFELQFCTYSYGARYWFRGDTVVGGQTYQVLCSTGIRPAPGAPAFCPPYTVDTTHCTRYALLRENVAEKQVFQFDFATNTEFLLFDFSVHAGDSVTVGNPPQTVYVEEEQEEPWFGGSTHRKLIVQSPLGGQASWVEGLGALNSLWNPLAPLCICPHLICYQASTQSPSGGECATVVHTEESTTGSAGLLLMPNPAGETITMAMPEGGLSFDRVVVFALSGQCKLEQQHAMGLFSIEIAVGGWPAGSYVAVVWRDGKWLGRQIFQKN